MSKRPGSFGSDYAKGMSQASWGLALAFGFVAIAAGCFFVGRWVDGWLSTEPWFQLVGALVGFVAATVTIYYGSQRSLD